MRYLPVLFLLLAFPSPANATPSFALEIDTGGVDELAVGAKLQCNAFLPLVFRARNQVPQPIRTELKWRVTPAGAAKIDEKGQLTALATGRVEIRVDDGRDLPKGQLPYGMTGYRELRISPPAKMDGDRLPRFEGIAGVRWLRIGRDEEQRLEILVASSDWSLYVTTGAPEGELPWKLDALPAHSRFNDQPGTDVITPGHVKRWRENLKRARLTITALKDGIVRGTLAFDSMPGVRGTVKFIARLA